MAILYWHCWITQFFFYKNELYFNHGIYVIFVHVVFKLVLFFFILLPNPNGQWQRDSSTSEGIHYFLEILSMHLCRLLSVPFGPEQEWRYL